MTLKEFFSRALPGYAADCERIEAMQPYEFDCELCSHSYKESREEAAYCLVCMDCARWYCVETVDFAGRFIVGRIVPVSAKKAAVYKTYGADYDRLERAVNRLEWALRPEASPL